MKIADLFCCEGGATIGLRSMGDEVVGFEMDRERLMLYNAKPGFRGFEKDVRNMHPSELRSFKFVWASPPCQTRSGAGHMNLWRHVDKYINMIATTRRLLERAKVPYYCIENTPTIQSMMDFDDYMDVHERDLYDCELSPRQRQPKYGRENACTFLCGRMFGLGVLRHRVFEGNFARLRSLTFDAHEHSLFHHTPNLVDPSLPHLTWHDNTINSWTRNLNMARDNARRIVAKYGDTFTVHGSGGGSKDRGTVEMWCDAMGIPRNLHAHFSRRGVTEMIPPAYTAAILAVVKRKPVSQTKWPMHKVPPERVLSEDKKRRTKLDKIIARALHR